MKLTVLIKYLGTAYAGFLVQPGKTTVQGELCRAFSEYFGFECNVTGCSRTDSGVHVDGFTATVEPKDKSIIMSERCTIPVGKLHRAVNLLLPDDIAVVGAAFSADNFHPRYDVEKKQYIYKIWDKPFRDPFLHGRVYEHGYPLSDSQLLRMNEAASLYVGRHDFSGFMAAGSKITDTVRSVYSASVTRCPDGTVTFSVEADGFLYNMVRIMAGTLIEAARGRKNDDDIRAAIQTGDRTKAGFTAPPEGLYLEKVTYPVPIEWQCD